MRRVPLIEELNRVRPELADAAAAIGAGRVIVEGREVTNPRSLVQRGCSIVVTAKPALRGSAKLHAALERFGVEVAGRVALDVGAAAGGFTSVLLEAGAERVYAVDAGHGQLRGFLRQDPRVINLEATNIAALTGELVPDAIDLFTVDVSYLSVAQAARQLQRVAIAPGADLVGLVKPMFELRRATAPADRESLHEALDRAVDGVVAGGWTVVGTMDSPVLGAKGAPELFVHGRWPSG